MSDQSAEQHPWRVELVVTLCCGVQCWGRSCCSCHRFAVVPHSLRCPSSPIRHAYRRCETRSSVPDARQNLQSAASAHIACTAGCHLPTTDAIHCPLSARTPFTLSADAEFEDLCFDFGIELDDVVRSSPPRLSPRLRPLQFSSSPLLSSAVSPVWCRRVSAR